MALLLLWGGSNLSWMMVVLCGNQWARELLKNRVRVGLRVFCFLCFFYFERWLDRPLEYLGNGKYDWFLHLDQEVQMLSKVLWVWEGVLSVKVYCAWKVYNSGMWKVEKPGLLVSMFLLFFNIIIFYFYLLEIGSPLMQYRQSFHILYSSQPHSSPL